MQLEVGVVRLPHQAADAQPDEEVGPALAGHALELGDVLGQPVAAELK